MMAYTSEDIKYHDMIKMYDTMKKLNYNELVDALDNVQELLNKKKAEHREKLIENFFDAYKKLADASIEIYCTCQECGEDVWLHEDDFKFI